MKDNTLKSKGSITIYGDGFLDKPNVKGGLTTIPLGNLSLLISIKSDNIFFHSGRELNLEHDGLISYKLTKEKVIFYPNFSLGIFFILLLFVIKGRKKYFIFFGLSLMLIIYNLAASSMVTKPPAPLLKSQLPSIDSVLTSFIAKTNGKYFNQTKYCHGDLHKLGAKYIKYGFTMAEIIAEPKVTFCAGGFVHGAIEQDGRVAHTLKEVVSFVNTGCLEVDKKYHDPMWLDNCLHASGHSFYYFENGHLLPSLKDCAIFKAYKVQYACQKGAFMGFLYVYQSKEKSVAMARNNFGNIDMISLCDSLDNPIFCQELIYDNIIKGDMKNLRGYLLCCDKLTHKKECQYGIGIIAYQNYVFDEFKNLNNYRNVCLGAESCYEGFLHAAALDLRFRGKAIDNNICLLTPILKPIICQRIYKNAYNFDPPFILENI